MLKRNELLWPYSLVLAISLAPLVWIILAIALALTSRYVGWPDKTTAPVLIPLVLLISLIPLLLHLLDYLSSQRAKIETQWIKIDFSQAAIAQTTIEGGPIRLPANIGIPGTPVPESGVAEITGALNDVTNNAVVVLDLEEGQAWWVTRLLALCGGAVRAGSPKAIVFVGTVSNKTSTFLGWVRPADALRGILNSNEEYLKRYIKAQQITQQLLVFGNGDLMPQIFNAGMNPTFNLNQEVLNYTYNPDLKLLGDAEFDQILLNQVRRPGSPVPGAIALESPPDRLTLNRLIELFGYCLYQEKIDLTCKDEDQIEGFFKSEAPYIALVRDGRYESLLERSAGETAILRSLYQAVSPKRA